ncbi:MAG: tetratricopeptide repeat protein [Vicinamibacterales bacterium]
MNRESLVFAISGAMFGLLIGWILGTQQGVAPAPVAVNAAAPASQTPAPTPPPVDVQRAADLERQANAQPANAAVRVDLGNLYFDAERYDLAASWYEAALKIDPNNVDASTDLGVSYYSANKVDRALAQFDHSLSLDPAHTKTLLNRGIVLAFGKQDLEGASRSWERLVAVAPNSPEATRAKEALAAVKSAHPATPTPPAAGRGGEAR